MARPVRFSDIGVAVHVDLKRNLSWVPSRGRAAEWQERTSFRAIVESFDVRVFWDVGANVGLYSWIFRTLSKDGEALLFEPDRFNLDLMARTVKASKLTGVTIIDKAVSDRVGMAEFFADAITGATGSLVRGEDGQLLERHFSERIEPALVETTTLDAELKGRGRDPTSRHRGRRTTRRAHRERLGRRRARAKPKRRGRSVARFAFPAPERLRSAARLVAAGRQFALVRRAAPA